MKKTLIMIFSFMLSLSMALLADDTKTDVKEGRKTETNGSKRSGYVNKEQQGLKMRERNRVRNEENDEAKKIREEERKETKRLRKESRKELNEVKRNRRARK